MWDRESRQLPVCCLCFSFPPAKPDLFSLPLTVFTDVTTDPSISCCAHGPPFERFTLKILLLRSISTLSFSRPFRGMCPISQNVSANSDVHQLQQDRQSLRQKIKPTSIEPKVSLTTLTMTVCDENPFLAIKLRSLRWWRQRERGGQDRVCQETCGSQTQQPCQWSR